MERIAHVVKDWPEGERKDLVRLLARLNENLTGRSLGRKR
jgi:hypothetical protein